MSQAEPAAVAGKIEDLLALFHQGISTAASRARIVAGLEELRQVYRAEPAAFREQDVAVLREISAALAAAPPLSPALPRPDPRQVLAEVFGHPSFRPGQEEIIDTVLAGRDCVGIMPTGAGKSLTYQLPARILGGLTLVVSPLISLMKDQVDAAQAQGIRATFLNSTLEPEERRQRLRDLVAGRYELLYAAPEGIEASVGWALERLSLSLVAVDEAHCISQWGHDFRPAYRNLSGLKSRFRVPILALTATATRQVTKDIIEQLGMEAPAEIRGSFFRPNLLVCAYKKGEQADGSVRDQIRRLVGSRPGKSGIVYCQSRKAVEATAQHLAEHGCRAAAYHAGLPPEVRTRVQDDFRAGAIDVVVATIAFGMGIDKPDVRYVVHRDMPRSVEGYYQEIGRAGRDGLPSHCILFYSWADVMILDRFAGEASEGERERQRAQVREMYRLADGRGCRHQRLVGYFGEAIRPCQASCDRCQDLDPLHEAREAVRQRAQEQAASRRRPHAAAGPASPAAPLAGEDGALFDRLKALRRELAEEHGVPAYVVFPDRTLHELASRRPQSPEAFLAIHGVGPRKWELFGPPFLRLLQER
ncbi:MAG: ATP-dependent DNA helicase RecQ [Thermodesulfobacteriota bacterium]